MKTRRIFHLKSGFTLVELLVSMAITMIIVTVLVSVTSMAMDTWNRSRSELRASRQAKAMVDTMARDFEALVTRSGNTYEWLSAIEEAVEDDVGGNQNASKLVFFTAATDRYKGEIGVAGVDLGGDVSCVGYRLARKVPIGGDSDEILKTFVLNRLLVDPKETFDTLLCQSDIGSKFLPSAALGVRLSEQENFVCENVFQFTVTFHVQVTVTDTAIPPVTVIRNVPVTLGEGTTKFQIHGNGNITDYVDPDTAAPDLALLIPSGRVSAIEISLSVLSDAGIKQWSAMRSKSKDKIAEWLAKNSNQYSKVVKSPSM